MECLAVTRVDGSGDLSKVFQRDGLSSLHPYFPQGELNSTLEPETREFSPDYKPAVMIIAGLRFLQVPLACRQQERDRQICHADKG